MTALNGTLIQSIAYLLESASVENDFTTAFTYNASSVGYVDVLSSAMSGDEYDIPFGSVASPKLVFVRNESGHDMGVRLNGANANEYLLPTNGFFCTGAPAGAGSTPLAELALFVTATQTTAGRIFYAVFGD